MRQPNPTRRRIVTMLAVPVLAASLLVVGAVRAGISGHAEAAVRTTSPVVSAVSRSADKLDVFGVDAGNRIYTAAWEPDFADGWHRWSQINGGIAAPNTSVYGVSRRPDNLDIFAVGSDRGVYTAAWQPSFKEGWHGWWRLGNLKVHAGTSVHAVSSARDRIDIFAVGEDSAVRRPTPIGRRCG